MTDREHDDVELIKRLESEGDRLSADYESNRWATAEAYHRALSNGMTQRQLAARIGKSHVHVGAMDRAHRYMLGNPDYQGRFADLYARFTGKQGNPKPDPAPEPDDDPEPEYGPAPGASPIGVRTLGDHGPLGA
ncbi:hypothetical protein ACL02T_12935 [Pseudonocardia sp. RS010]|uniref:hypothetical protein n=1 Tax=Pseudonocardia sp. RS010 TaxID=3385979 RepID=UPI0039A3767D